MEKMVFEVSDRIARIAWSRLLGTEVSGNKVYLMRDAYERNAVAIQHIQFAAAFRKPQDGEAGRE